MHSAVTKILGPAKDVNAQIQSWLGYVSGSLDIVTYLADDWGAVGDGVTDDTTAIQAAWDALNVLGGGQLILTPGKSYLCTSLFARSNTLFNLNRGTLLAKHAASNNQLFAFGVGIAGQTKISLSSAAAGATSITVTSSTSFVIGERVLISAGTFTGSGSEEGPVEYNTVTAKPDGTHITVQNPLRYNYGSFGLPGQSSPGVYRVESFTRGLIRDVRITNGILKPNGSDDPVYFNGSGERIVIDHLFMDGYGSQLMTGGYIGGLRFHDNLIKGLGNAAGGGINQASTHDFFFSDNIFAMGDDSGSNNRNGFQLEVCCRDGLIARNLFGPKRATAGGAIELTYYCFNNRIAGNIIHGLPSDVSGGTATLGIRTYANSASPLSWMGNTIVNNQVFDIMNPIGDTMPCSLIDGNLLSNSTSHANSQGIVMNTGKGILGINTIIGFTNPVWDGSSAVPTTQAQLGVASIFQGNGTPEGVVTAPVGSEFFRLNGGDGQARYFKESGSGNTGWKRPFTASETSPSQITSNQNNYNPGGQGFFLRLSTDASRNITGLTFTDAQVSGECHRIQNVGSNPIILKHQDAGSTSTNRFLCETGTDITLLGDWSAEVKYDGTTQRWRVAAPSGCPVTARVFHSTTQTLTTGVAAALNFDSERFDTAAIHDTVTNNTRLTAPLAGKYFISASIGFFPNGAGNRQVYFQVNGATVIAAEFRAGNAGSDRMTVTTEYNLAAGDYVECIAFQTSGGNLTTEQTGNFTPEFMMSLVK